MILINYSFYSEENLDMYTLFKLFMLSEVNREQGVD